MHSAVLLSILGSGLLVAAEIVGNWTLYSFRRVCYEAEDVVESSCAYSFAISENFVGAWSRCSLLVVPAGNEPAAQSTVASAPCNEAESAEYRISAGWDPAGFIVVTVHNTSAGADAFFGYTDAELAEGRTVPFRTEPAYTVGTFTAGPGARFGAGAPIPASIPASIPARRLSRVFRDRKRHDDAQDESSSVGSAEEEPRCDPSYWVVRSLKRGVDTESQRVLIGFDLFRCDNTTHCEFDTAGAGISEDIAHDNFYNVACDNNPDITVSWGYKKDTDGGVMTVMDLSLGRRVFVGWDHVNGRVSISEEGKGEWEPYH